MEEWEEEEENDDYCSSYSDKSLILYYYDCYSYSSLIHVDDDSTQTGGDTQLIAA